MAEKISPTHKLQAEIFRQLHSDILSVGWLRQLAELDFHFSAGAASSQAVLEAIVSLVDSGVAVVGEAKNESGMVVIHAWCERGEALKEKMIRQMDTASQEDRDWAFWLQLVASSRTK